MATNDRLECVLENLYKAALGDVAWVSTAALINDALQTTGHGVVDGDPLPRRESRRAMADANALGASLADMLENRHSGIIQLDRRGRILEANDEARNLLLKREGLRDEKGVLVAEDQAENAELQRLLSAALPPFGLQGAGGSIKISRRKARLPLVLDIHPARAAIQAGFDPIPRPPKRGYRFAYPLHKLVSIWFTKRGGAEWRHGELRTGEAR